MCAEWLPWRGDTPASIAVSGLRLLFVPSHATGATGASGAGFGSLPTLAAIISKRKKVAGAAATTRHASNSSHGAVWRLCVTYTNCNRP